MTTPILIEKTIKLWVCHCGFEAFGELEAQACEDSHDGQAVLRGFEQTPGAPDEVLATGTWPADAISVRWVDGTYEPRPRVTIRLAHLTGTRRGTTWGAAREDEPDLHPERAAEYMRAWIKILDGGHVRAGGRMAKGAEWT